MFTGIIQSTGKVSELKKNGDGSSYRLKLLSRILNLKNDPIILGESIATNGTCLTVINVASSAQIDAGTDEEITELTFDLAPETVARTALAKLTPGRMVNLERSLKLGDRMSGHWVQGHVDGTAVLIESKPLSGGNIELVFELNDHNLLKYCVKKGSIALDGISLTIHEIQQNQLKFQIIPHTLQETNLSDLLNGEKVNIEVDVLAKYLENYATFK